MLAAAAAAAAGNGTKTSLRRLSSPLRSRPCGRCGTRRGTRCCLLQTHRRTGAQRHRCRQEGEARALSATKAQRNCRFYTQKSTDANTHIQPRTKKINYTKQHERAAQSHTQTHRPAAAAAAQMDAEEEEAEEQPTSVQDHIHVPRRGPQADTDVVVPQRHRSGSAVYGGQQLPARCPAPRRHIHVGRQLLLRLRSLSLVPHWKDGVPALCAARDVLPQRHGCWWREERAVPV